MDDFELIRTAPFIGAKDNIKSARVVLFGLPFDSTCSFRPGARFGPQGIRAVSDVLETYCPELDRDLGEVDFVDLGDLPLPPGDPQASVNKAYEFARQILARGQITGGLGGEHLLSLPLVQAAHEAYPELVLVQFDAHMDMRNEYLGVSLSHASVMRHAENQLGSERILRIATRSGTRDEFSLARRQGNLKPATVSASEIRDWVGDRPLYITVDLDVLDPSVLPGTGTPEPGGVEFSTLQKWLVGLSDCQIVAWDVMELAPYLDTTQVSSVVAAKIVRTLVLASGVTQWAKQ